VEPKEALQRAVEELGRQRAEIEQLRRGSGDPIAIVGMGCRFPGAPTVDAYWDLLARGGDAITEVPRERWNADAFFDADPAAPGKMSTRKGGFITGVDRFDPQFFGIAPREAQSMDPQQRLLLEVAWEALENANIAPPDLYGSATAVFTGITCFDHAIRMSQAAENFNSYAGTGSALNMAPGRLSYVLGLTGPSLAVDTACSSSLVCLHLACQSLRQRESNLALVGGVHLILSPHVMVSFSQARMLAADGHSKTFDASADGYSRGEGCGVVVLKRLADARASGDTVLGVIRGTAVNQDGPSGGLTVPNGASQQQVIRRALDAAGVAPAAVAYVEAHGTGTSLGDPIEVEALARVYGEGRAPAQPLLIGSVKTNIGHLEPAAGMASLIKVLLAFRHGQIPRHLHFRTPNPHIAWSQLPVKVTSEAVTWPRSTTPRIAGLSAFGFSGTNAHVILEEPPVSARAARAALSRAQQLLVLSAKTEAALRDSARRYATALSQMSEPDLSAVCYTAAIGRAHFPHRLVVEASSVAEARKALEAFADERSSTLVRHGKAANAEYRRDATEVKSRLAGAYDRIARNDAGALAEIAALYLEGVAIDWPKIFGDPLPERVSLPTYPFQRERYWIDTPDQVASSPAFTPWLYQLVWAKQGDAASQFDPDGNRRWAIVSNDRALAAELEGVLGRAELSDASDIIYVASAQDADGAITACTDVLSLIQSSLASGATPRIWVITRGAFPVEGTMTIAGASHAPVAAFTRGLGLEHPELFGRVIDLDATPAPGDAEKIVAEILCDDTEDQIAIRGHQRYAQRIDYVTDLATKPLPLRADAMYLVTGGLGRIGLQVAADLVARGARHLCLLGRGALTADQVSTVKALEAKGATVRSQSGDVADRAAMTALIHSLSSGPPLGGIVHLAGVPGYADIDRLTPEIVAAVMRPKIHGAAVLDELTRDLPLDFFVSFSSIASAWGSRGQAHYAAGNAFLDALAHLRHAAGRPAVTINWGPWAGGGMTSSEAETLLRRVGIRTLAADQALAAMGALATGPHTQVVVADIDWTLFKGSYEARGHRRLLERLKGVTTDHVAGMDSELARLVSGTAAGDRDRVMAAVIQREVAQVLALPDAGDADPGQGLFEMGMDSLMSLELRTRLQTLVGRSLPATLVFDYPTIGAMAHFLVQELTGRVEGVAAMAPPATATVSDLDTLSDAEAEALLLKKLESIH